MPRSPHQCDLHVQSTRRQPIRALVCRAAASFNNSASSYQTDRGTKAQSCASITVR
jgi:hypothetical protein